MISESSCNCTQFIRRETEAQGDSITFPRAHSWWQGGNSEYPRAQADGCLKETRTWVFQTWLDKSSSWPWGLLVCARQAYTRGLTRVHVEPLTRVRTGRHCLSAKQWGKVVASFKSRKWVCSPCLSSWFCSEIKAVVPGWLPLWVCVFVASLMRTGRTWFVLACHASLLSLLEGRGSGT